MNNSIAQNICDNVRMGVEGISRPDMPLDMFPQKVRKNGSSGLVDEAITQAGEKNVDAGKVLESENKHMIDSLAFSFFHAPIRNTTPCEAIGIQDAYRYITGPIAKERTERLRSMTSSDEAKRCKANDFDYCTFSGVFKHRSSSELLQHSGLICVDFDDVDDIPALKKRLLRHEYFNTVLMFTSPSGNGVKWIVEVDLQGWDHSRFFKSMVSCLEATGLPPVDTSGSDVTRACFLPYDPDAYVIQDSGNTPKKTFDPKQWEERSVSTPKPTNAIPRHCDVENDVDAVVSLIERQMVDIAPSYDEWVRLGYALADEFSEGGRCYFQRLSALHPGCTREAADSQYSKCINSTGSGVTISTFFHMAKTAGVSISHAYGIAEKWNNGNIVGEKEEDETQISICRNFHEDNTDIPAKWVLEEEELPVFPEEVYERLPTILDNVVKNAISPSDREVLLIGAITVLSSTLKNVCGVYDERTVFPNLYLFVVADAGMGKGALTLCRELVAPIDSELQEHARMLAENCAKGKENDVPMLTLVIPANISTSALIKTLSDNKGVGLMFETEGDTLSQTLKTDYGNFSDVLRKAFHHETVSLCRRKDREFLKLNCPKLSVALAGTPCQVRNLIPDSENGLFSRFIFYNIKFEQNIRNVFTITDPSRSKTELFLAMGKHYKDLLGKIHREASSYEISIPPLLQGYFMDHYNRLNSEGCRAIGNKAQAVVRRNGLIAFRIMMVLTILRHLTDDVYAPVNDGESLKIECSDEDFHTALTIAETLLYHSAFILRQMVRTVSSFSGKVDRKENLYAMLPHSFNKQVYLSAVRELGYSESTCNKWLMYFLATNRLRHCSHSLYEKVNDESLPNDADVQ